MKFFKISIWVAIISAVILTIVYLALINGYSRYYTFEQSKLREIIKGNEKFDILFIGSSRTLYHVNPKIIDSALNCNSYNAGVDGARLPEMNLMFKSYLVNHPPPEIVVADLSTTAFCLDENAFFNPNIYYPWLSNDIVYNSIAPYKRVGLLKTLPFLQLTEWDDHMLQGAIIGLTGKQKPLPADYKGHLKSGEDTIVLPFKMRYLTTNWPVHTSGISLLDEIITLCKKNHIKLIFTYSPVYQLKDEVVNEEFFPTVERIRAENEIPFLNYRHLPMNGDHLIFRDEHHLNTKGADIYSRLLAADLKTFARM